MHVTAALVLFANALFTVIAWPQFLRRVARDPRARDADGRVTAFFRVHIVLVAVALLLAAASLVAGAALIAVG